MNEAFVTYEQATVLKNTLTRLRLGVGDPQIVMGVEREAVVRDQGVQEYEIKVGDHYIGVGKCLSMLKLLSTAELKLKFLANLCGVLNQEIESALSRFQRMQQMREMLFESWYSNGRPESQ